MQNPPEISSEGFLLPRLNSVIFSALSCLDKLFLQDYNEPVYYRIFLLWTALGPVFFAETLCPYTEQEKPRKEVENLR